ncbi:MAG: hypothetical protein H6830_11110 [Planctomycetes bacterium]|nr:hypothetical protein [Planctomycetota bacterium]HPF13973.1 protein-disulfide reductase DsbD family protein [Planctomycetota bacterium]HRV81098.1 protein-disulfide reductase DsbD family protein [Planctomycetota bacterium]
MTLRSLLTWICGASLAVGVAWTLGSEAHEASQPSLNPPVPPAGRPQEPVPDAAPGEPETQPLVEWRMLLDVEALVPGQQAHLVAALTVPKDWHIYWESPGEAGMATFVEVHGPKGWTIGRPIFPGPKLYRDAQGNVCHVLEGEVGFFVPVVAPEDAVPGTEATFQVEMQWLQCQEICLLGGFKTEVRYPIASGYPKRVADRALANMRKQLPRKGLGPLDVGISFGGDPEEANLSFFTKDARSFEFFAYPDSPMALFQRDAGVEAATGSQRNFVLRPNLEAELETIEVRGVLRLANKERVTFFEVAYKGPQLREPSDQPTGHGALPTIPRKQ